MIRLFHRSWKVQLALCCKSVGKAHSVQKALRRAQAITIQCQHPQSYPTNFSSSPGSPGLLYAECVAFLLFPCIFPEGKKVWPSKSCDGERRRRSSQSLCFSQGPKCVIVCQNLQENGNRSRWKKRSEKGSFEEPSSR